MRSLHASVAARGGRAAGNVGTASWRIGEALTNIKKCQKETSDWASSHYTVAGRELITILVLTVIKYIPSNVTVNGNDKYPVSVDIIHIPQIAAFAMYFQPSKLVIRILMDLYSPSKIAYHVLYQASLADALRVWELGEASNAQCYEWSLQYNPSTLAPNTQVCIYLKKHEEHKIYKYV